MSEFVPPPAYPSEAVAIDDRQEWLFPSAGHNNLLQLHWRKIDIVVAVTFLVAWREGISMLQAHREVIPTLVLVLAGTVVPLVFVGLFPIWAYRRAGGRVPVRLPSIERCVTEATLAFPVMLLALVALFAVSLLWRHVTAEAPEMDERLRGIVFSRNPWLLALFSLGACIWAPLAEELFFRGFLQNALARRMPVIAAAVIQIALFAAMHPYSGAQMVGIVVIGAFLTAHYLWRKTLLASMFLHALFNGLMLALGALLMFVASRAPVLGIQLDEQSDRCRIQAVYAGSSADAAGLSGGDIILQLDGRPITNGAALQVEMLSLQPGQRVTLQIERNGTLLDLEATLQQRQDMTTLIREAPDVTR
ncbi:MAG: CPBP family intramembrane metalloprotease [Planctomycetaceae bacterium]|nr:CPBP family intramembrane metalloprotease [Planctomycetaceae bacterium]